MTAIPGDSTRQSSARIIGVVGDALLGRLRSERHGTIYWPLGQTGAHAKFQRSNPPIVLVRAQKPAAIAHAVETALIRMNPRVRPMAGVIDERIHEYIGAARTMAVLALAAAGLALVLAVLGVYGVTAFAVSQRTHEVGVRMAIGASRADILRLVVGRSLRPIAFGQAAGLAVALLASRVIASMLAGIGPRDPVAIAVAVAVLLGSALVAVIAPARRAAAADPANILRT